ncbi:MAG: zinc-binding dehydrogenase [Caulobacteraceae bacterium]|nr:zinc-binding dehydrogenase [Caulobacter sp.]
MASAHAVRLCLEAGADDDALRARLVVVSSRSAELAQPAAWADAGQLRPVIDGRGGLPSTASAHRRVEARHKRGEGLVRLA